MQHALGQIIYSDPKKSHIVDYPRCLLLAGGTRICGLRQYSFQRMQEVVLPALRSVRGEALAGDLLIHNFG